MELVFKDSIFERGNVFSIQVFHERIIYNSKVFFDYTT